MTSTAAGTATAQQQHSPIDPAKAFLESLRCAQCGQRRRLSELTVCLACNPDLRRSRKYLCINHCHKSSCNHAEACEIEGHSSCWYIHISNLSEWMREGHDKTSAIADGCVQVIVPRHVDDEAQRLHHQRDRNAEWFRVTMARLTAQGEEPYLQISDRFKQCCNPGSGNYWSVGQYPGLVSFIGDTGVGKSTLVRAMNIVGVVEKLHKAGDIDWERVFRCRVHGPVTKSTSAKKSHIPTSVGVHLYRDQTTDDDGNREDVPILYADCEGFSASDMVTDAELSARPVQSPTVGRPRSGSASSQGSSTSMHTSGNFPSIASLASVMSGMDSAFLREEIRVTAEGFKVKGKTSTEMFYARFLYAFSDVVVFVINEESKMKREMQRLLEWCVSAVKMSIRRTSPRTLIMVRNGPRQHDDSFYDDTDLKNEMFRNFGQIWEGSSILLDYKQRHDQFCTRHEDKILDNDQYFGRFFQETIICYVPGLQNGPTPDRLYGQYLHLRKLIVKGLAAAQKARSRSLVRHDVASLTHLTNSAFRHFAQYDDPFDFHFAARKDNPTPISIPGHIANLLRHLGSGRDQLERFENHVAICLVTYHYRSFRVGGEPEGIFEDDLQEKCHKGIAIYQEMFLRCALEMKDGTRCVNFAYNHGLRHCSEKNLIWQGQFAIDRTGFAKDTTDVVLGIKNAFIAMYMELWAGFKDGTTPSLKRTSEYRCQILGKEPEPTPNLLTRVGTLKAKDFTEPSQVWSDVKSNMTCFACLQYAPDHVLPCSHGYCEDCVKDLGKVRQNVRYTYEMDRCVLCSWKATASSPDSHDAVGNAEPAAPANSDNTAKARPQATPQIVRLNPRCGGIRILALDGGGIRSIIELALLEKVLDRTGLKLPARDYFDLIVGTSTGGIISLAITSSPRSPSVQEFASDFMALAEKVFKHDRFGILWRLDPLQVVNRSTISTVAMGLRLIKSRLSVTTAMQRGTRVAVTTTSDGEPSLFANYSRAAFDREDLRDRDHLVENRGFERQDNPEKEARVWEAAMATSAAPPYFHEWRIDDPENRRKPQVPFADGALHSNLPVERALEEQDRIWPEHQNYKKPLDLMISIGTGQQPEKFKLPKWLDFGGTRELALAYFNNIFDTDSVWEAFTKGRNYSRYHHFRLQVVLEKNIDLNEWDKMLFLYDKVNRDYAESKKTKEAGGLWNQIEYVAYKLTASLLFFEPEKCEMQPSGPGRRRETISGHIWCRLQTPTPALRALIERIDGFYHLEQDQQPMPMQLLRGWRDTLLRQERANQPFELPCALDSTADTSLQQSVLVKLKPPTEAGNSTLFPISGFPITYNELKAGMKQRGVQ